MDPTSRIDAALLEYARHYGIADDPKSPDSYLIDGGLDNTFPDTAPSNPHAMHERHEELESELGHYLNHEKLDISIEEGRLLASARCVEQDALRPGLTRFLPSLRSVRSLRDEPLLQTQDEEERTRKIDQDDAMELEKEIDATEERPSSSSRQPSTNLARAQSTKRASNTPAAFVDTVLAISKTEKDPTPPPISPVTLSPSIRHSSIHADLGSLNSFMESRGIVLKPPAHHSIFNCHTPGHVTASFGGNPRTMHPVPLMSPPSIPAKQRACMEDQVLFLSSDLLNTHLPLIQSLESPPYAPNLVYRDYDTSQNVEDADIIIPPMTGIIFTTSQALTQRPLPGEEKDYECPVLSRIYRLAPRYEHFYVLVVSTELVDSRTADALAFLKVFCGSVSENTKVIPLITSSEEVVDWVLALAFERGERE